ncbi:MAG: 50S ribosomal protein L25/general stress protein Ctc [Gammaproteobacteria bacterium]|nr:50S ribosomal protein L25/general stress protein Ctc [Gammaproteobacteria bacterium]HBW84641.1 50S ribosomal protein L25 [Gammaproteobacteria bacterium]|tara:strand:- start:2597 stop:3262 length:666 start_codon:yes stop_codon:yes gene_type:complete
MSADQFELNCSVRTDAGKGASRRLRRLDNAIPAILYGGNKDPIAITIAHDDILHATENEAFFSHVITLKIGKKKEKAVIKALQRHPAKPFIMHADFLRVDEKQAITVKVPLHFVNEDKCVGVKLGSGSIRKTLNEIEISCLPSNLPEYIEVDMLDVEVGQTLHISDIALPQGVTSVALSHGGDSDLSIAQVQAPRGGGDGSDADADGGSTAADDSGDGADN